MSDRHTEAMRGTYFSKKKQIPTHDLQTGELNPYYEQLTGKKNPMGDREDAYREMYKNSLQLGEYNNSGKLRMSKDLMNSRYEYFKDMPNQKWHKIISFIKSGIRILGYAVIPFDLVIATGVLILSEVVGIVEELV